MTSASGRQLIGAAVIVGVAVLAGSLIVSSSLGQLGRQLEETTGRLDQIRVAVNDSKEALSNLQVAAAPAAAPRRGPDPDRRYTVSTEGSPALGPASAPVSIVEFSDFQCPFCSKVTPTLKQIHDDYGDQVRIVFKHLPLSIHPKAPAAHAATEAAHNQGKFWEMHDKIFENQREMSPEKYQEWASEMGLDVEQFKQDSSSPEVAKRIDRDKLEAAKLGATGTPAFFINGRYVEGAKPFETFKVIIDEELAKKKST